MQVFIFDSLYSEMAEEEFDSPNDQDPISNKNFLKYNYRELAKIATKGNRKQKDWLRDFLAHRDDSLERQSLQSALGDSQP
jgi:hypothetical protein